MLDGYPIWLTFICGQDNDYLYSMVLDEGNNTWICGKTRSSDFYVKNAITHYSSGGTADGAISKIDDGGNVTFSTWLAGQIVRISLWSIEIRTTLVKEMV